MRFPITVLHRFQRPSGRFGELGDFDYSEPMAEDADCLQPSMGTYGIGDWCDKPIERAAAIGQCEPFNYIQV